MFKNRDKVKNRVRVGVTVRVRVRFKVMVSVSVNDTNSGAGELADKYPKITRANFLSTGQRSRFRSMYIKKLMRTTDMSPIDNLGYPR